MQMPSEGQNNSSVARTTQQGDISTKSGPVSRRSWITEWQINNPGRPTPCSAKAVYRLADSKLHLGPPDDKLQLILDTELDLHDLKERAFQVEKVSFLISTLSLIGLRFSISKGR
jgi:hypothetical protein